MSYLNVIPLETAKTHLRVDHNASDNEITRMIKSACRYIEKYTNILLFEREVTYHLDDSDCVLVYEWPIQSKVSTFDVESVRKSTYSIYTVRDQDELVLSVGYALLEDVPEDLIDAALAIIDVWFFGSEKQVDTTLIPMDVKQTLDLYKRFII